MIEVIYKEESQETQDSEGTFGLPRNIRQIGLIGDDCRIYMEDYVYTFLVRLARSEKKAGRTGSENSGAYRGNEVQGRNPVSFY